MSIGNRGAIEANNETVFLATQLLNLSVDVLVGEINDP